MTEHKCHKCGKSFNRKSTLDRHLKKVYQCDRKEAIFKCINCNKKFTRKDALDRHIRTIHSDMIATNINNNNENNIVNNINGNKNNVTVNQYFLTPFGNYHLDEDLTTTEKTGIFTSKYSIIEMIIFKTHLNPALEKYHNCGITDLHSGYGLINDGKNWEYWPIKDIMTVLIDNGQQNSLKLYDKIKHFFQDDTREEIENDLDNDKHILYPRHNFFDIDVKAKKRLVSSLKSKFYNQRNLVQTAVKNSGQKIPKYENNEQNLEKFLKEGVTIKDIDDYLKKDMVKEAENEKLLSLKKEVATYILEKFNEIHNTKYNKLVDQINKIDNIEHMNIILRVLDKSYCRGSNLNNIKLTNEINKQTKMNEMVFV